MAELPLVRSSERGDFKHCQQRWWWRYVEQLVPTMVKPGDREFGTGWHLCMAEHYIPGTKRGAPLLETWETWCKTTETQLKKDGNWTGAEQEWADRFELGKLMLAEYDWWYQGDPHMEVIAQELTFQANLANMARDVGTIDLVYRDLNTGKIEIMDHKTCNGFPNFKFLVLDDQFGSYLSFGQHILRQQGLIGPKERVHGLVGSYARKSKPDTRPVNEAGQYTNNPLKKHYLEALAGYDHNPKAKMEDLAILAENLGIEVLGEVSKVQGQPLFHREPMIKTPKQRNRQLTRIVDDVVAMDAVRHGVVPVTKAPGKLCAYCDFFDLCDVDEAGGDTETFKLRMFKKMDPYHDHREGAINSKLSVAADREVKHG